MKLIIINVFFGVVLFGGLFFGKLLFGYVFNVVFWLDDEGWCKFIFCWGLFFLFFVVFNEVVWCNFFDDVWIIFKVWGIMFIIIFFIML